MKHPLFEALAKAAQASEPVALGVISGVKGSSPQKVGAKALFYADGRIKGTLGGGCLEAEIQQRAIHSLRHRQPESFELVLDHDFGWDDGLVCGGKVKGLIVPDAQAVGAAFWAELAGRGTRLGWGITRAYKIAPDLGTSSESEWLYREQVTPPVELWIAGAGHVAQAVAALAVKLDFGVTVMDDRPALASPDYFPPHISLRSDLWENLLKLPLPEGPVLGLIVTRGHRHDALVLRDWIKKPFTFLGMIGSSRKARTIFEHFLQEGLATPEELRRIACPVGIKIRAQTVPEIAVSIMAQFIEKRAELWGAAQPASTGVLENPPCPLD